MTLASFHPAADLARTLPPIPPSIEQQHVLAAKRAAQQRLARELSVPSKLYAVASWLEAAPAEDMLRELLRCMLSVDCWQARIPCPLRRFTVRTWQNYLSSRLEAAHVLLSNALTRWAVLERIPVRWIPKAQVSAQLSMAIAPFGMEARSMVLDLMPPITGGHEWVRRDCEQSVATLLTCARRAPTAVILHWAHRSAAAVVTTANGGLKIFGTAFDRDGEMLEADDLVAGTVVQPAAAPLSIFQRCLRRVGLQERWWDWIRRRRIQRNA